MTTPEDDVADVPRAPLPREGPCRVVEDADARGIPVPLQGGEVWYIAPMPLSTRGVRLAQLLDALEAQEVDLAAAQKTVALVTARLDAATDESEVVEAQKRLHGAVARRNEAARSVTATHTEIAFHALRCHYRVTREEASLLVTQRRWPDILAALNGRDTERSQQEAAIDLFARLNAVTKGREGPPSGDPFGPASPNSSGGAAPA